MNFKKFISFGFSIIFTVSCLNFTEKIYAMDSNNKYNEDLSRFEYHDCFQGCNSKLLREIFTMLFCQCPLSALIVCLIMKVMILALTELRFNYCVTLGEQKIYRKQLNL